MQTSNSNPVATHKWFLGTGPKEYFYTLWKEVIIHPVPGTNIGGAYWYYLGNLSHTYEEAVAKATERTAGRQTIWEQFDISDYRRLNSGAPDLDKSPEEVELTFGKYAGKTLAQVLEDDFGYVLFLALKSDWEPNKARFAKPLNYIRCMFRAQAQKAEDDKKARIAAERAARDAARAELPAFNGRVTILGTVISTKVVDSQFGSTVKMLIEHASGWRIWGTVPSSIGGLEKGDVVQFDAIVTKSDKDPKFGFFSRPTKATLVKSADILEPVQDSRDRYEAECEWARF